MNWWTVCNADEFSMNPVTIRRVETSCMMYVAPELVLPLARRVREPAKVSG